MKGCRIFHLLIVAERFCKVISGKEYTSRQFAVPPSGGVMPPEGGTANSDPVCFFPEIT
ncbi:hypothetical protein QUF80_21190 [Desulfococcaceae bacterium HSG8]|nr:hypothetical protein [Desulfococcaceae bacterium HSG8]